MVRYALFGTSRAAGAASRREAQQGHAGLRHQGRELSGRARRVEVLLSRGEEPLASGTKAVNLKVVEIFGYGLTVFDTNVANQGEIEALGRMQPAERRRMVDSVVGLGAIDQLVEWAGNEASAEPRGRGGSARAEWRGRAE
jgi:hypothetical protein